MLKRVRISNFKSLEDVEVELAPLTVLFGPNGSGKSNFLDTIQTLSRLGTCRTVSEAMETPARGYPIEAFGFPEEGLPGLFGREYSAFSLEADLHVEKNAYRYSIQIRIQPESGNLGVYDESLSPLSASGIPCGTPSIEVVDGQIQIHGKSKSTKPGREPLGVNFSILSDLRLRGAEYPHIERCRNEFSAWKTYYLDPRVAMRTATPPKEVNDIGDLGEAIAPFLFRLKSEKPKHFGGLRRTLRSIVPSVEDVGIDLDKKRGILDIAIRQYGREFSARILSEGTLRVLALCAIAVNPWGGSLIAFEEPENGVHPQRLELIAEMLSSLAIHQGRQVIVTTHSPLLCQAVLQNARSHPEKVALMKVSRERTGTKIEPLRSFGPLFEDVEIREALGSEFEDGLFEDLLLRGVMDD